MNRRGIKIGLTSLLLILSFNIIPAQASKISFVNDQVEIEKNDEKSKLLSVNSVRASDIVNASPRGTILSTSYIEIIDEGRGDVGILIETLAHVQCDEIQHEAILERLNEATNKWEEIDRYSFSAKQEDNPNEKLTALTTSFTVKKQKTGYFYRVRGMHAVWSNGVSEGASTRTDGILIKK